MNGFLTDIRCILRNDNKGGCKQTRSKINHRMDREQHKFCPDVQDDNSLTYVLCCIGQEGRGNNRIKSKSRRAGKQCTSISVYWSQFGHLHLYPWPRLSSMTYKLINSQIWLEAVHDHGVFCSFYTGTQACTQDSLLIQSNNQLEPKDHWSFGLLKMDSRRDTIKTLPHDLDNLAFIYASKRSTFNQWELHLPYT